MNNSTLNTIARRTCTAAILVLIGIIIWIAFSSPKPGDAIIPALVVGLCIGFVLGCIFLQILRTGTNDGKPAPSATWVTLGLVGRKTARPHVILSLSGGRGGSMSLGLWIADATGIAQATRMAHSVSHIGGIPLQNHIKDWTDLSTPLADPPFNTWPLGINPPMDDQAAAIGLSHWSCYSSSGADWWVRRDGHKHKAFVELEADYPTELRDIDRRFPFMLPPF